MENSSEALRQIEERVGLPQRLLNASALPRLGSTATNRHASYGLAGHFRLEGLRGSKMLKYNRQNLGSEALEIGILTRADLVFQELHRLLMLNHLPLEVGQVEFGAIGCGEPVAHSLVFFVEFLRHRDAILLREVDQSVVRGNRA